MLALSATVFAGNSSLFAYAVSVGFSALATYALNLFIDTDPVSVYAEAFVH